MPKIEEMYAFIADDTQQGDEGVVGAKFGDQWLPFVGADMAMVEKLRPVAQKMQEASGKPIHLVKFTHREDLGPV